ncbi:unnamed protein product [Brugia timori]|uniref:MYND-type domain-containing protein n=1 Tax=Brugia timori TaxID=42155 RepID=A0A0R3QXA4_9BILA|nr:unnamed protein product [Brugia timori]
MKSYRCSVCASMRCVRACVQACTYANKLHYFCQLNKCLHKLYINDKKLLKQETTANLL